LKDIFDLQDDITVRVVGAIAPKLEDAEIVRAMRKPTESLDGYDYYLRARSHFHKAGKNDISEALRLFLKAVELNAASVTVKQAEIADICCPIAQ
jgi:hypothetical protein